MNVQPPKCFGMLYDASAPECSCCLVQGKCKAASGAEVSNSQSGTADNAHIPKDKKLLALAVCRKFGLSTSYYPKGSDQLYEVKEDNLSEFSSIDFLITNKESLVKLMQVRT